MNILINNYGKLIEQLRKDRKLSRQDLCNDIMSVRNYQRFSQDEVKISHDKLLKLIDRIGLDYFTFHQIYKTRIGNEHNHLINAFNHTCNWEFQKAELQLAFVDKENVESGYDTQMYMITKALINLKKKTLASENWYTEIEKAIDFPKILEKKVINMIELNALFTLNRKYSSNQDSKVTDYFINLLDNGYENLGIRGDFIPAVHASICQSLYRLDRHYEVIEYADKGIEYCKTNQRLSGYANLLGYKALSQNKVGDFDEAIENAILVFMELKIEDNPEKTRLFTEIMETNLNINYEELIYIKQKD